MRTIYTFRFSGCIIRPEICVSVVISFSVDFGPDRNATCGRIAGSAVRTRASPHICEYIFLSPARHGAGDIIEWKPRGGSSWNCILTWQETLFNGALSQVGLGRGGRARGGPTTCRTRAFRVGEEIPEPGQRETRALSIAPPGNWRVRGSDGKDGTMQAIRSAVIRAWVSIKLVRLPVVRPVSCVELGFVGVPRF